MSEHQAHKRLISIEAACHCHAAGAYLDNAISIIVHLCKHIAVLLRLRWLHERERISPLPCITCWSLQYSALAISLIAGTV